MSDDGLEFAPRPLTPDEARTIDLPVNPFARVRRIGELADQTMPGVVVLGPQLGGRLADTRSGLIRVAEIHEAALAWEDRFQQAFNRTDEQI